MKQLNWLILFSLFSSIAHSQSVAFDWAVSYGDISQDRGNFVTTDSFGNVYSTGSFWGVVDFDAGFDTLNLVSNGDEDIFIQKLNSKGEHVWTHSFGSQSRDQGISICIDNQGFIYLTGVFQDTVDFDPDTTQLNLISAGYQDVFVQKLDSSGKLVWAKSISGLKNDYVYVSSIDPQNNLLITGIFADTTDFDPGLATHFLHPSNPAFHDQFILKLDLNGNFVWVKSFGGFINGAGWAMTSDINSNIYVAGIFTSNAVDFDPGPAVYNLIPNGIVDYFILKLNSFGNFIWANSFGGNSLDYALSITSDQLGDIYLTGWFRDSVDFDPGSANFSLISNGNSDCFVQKLDGAGKFKWVKSFGGISNDNVTCIKIDDKGYIYLTGFFEDTVDFDPGIDTFNLVSNGYRDVFILKLDTSGHFIWVKSIGGSKLDVGSSINIDLNNDILVAGIYNDRVNFNPCGDTFYLTSNGREDIFIQKLHQCDLNTQIVSDGTKLIATETETIYQWLDCSNGYSIVVGETSQIFIPTSNGSYAVGLFSKGCADTSECVEISTIGFGENNLFLDVRIYPNPTMGFVNIDFKGLNSVDVKVFNVLGKLVFEEKNIDQIPYQFDLNAPPGVYTIEISTQVEKRQFKLVKR